MITNDQRADALAVIAARIDDAMSEARDILRGTGPILEHARTWLAHLDRATGVERTRTIEDTIDELRSAGHEGDHLAAAVGVGRDDWAEDRRE
jgi:hypothetical protein